MKVLAWFGLIAMSFQVVALLIYTVFAPFVETNEKLVTLLWAGGSGAVVAFFIQYLF